MTRLIWRGRCEHVDIRVPDDDRPTPPVAHCRDCGGRELTWTRWEVTERESPWTSARRDPETNKVTIRHGNTVRRTLRRVK